jgi:4-hydroxysphinganine ceramide fatty acyl 2-hydroxylase
MPSRTFLQSEVALRNTSKSCYVTMGTKVYDITGFLDSHPGGGDLILEYGGKDVTEILKDEVSHSHSEAAYEILDDSLVGSVATEGAMDAVTKSKRPAQIVPLPPAQDGMVELKANGVANVAAPEVYSATGMSSEEDLSKETDAVTDYKTHKFLDLNRPLIPQVWYSGFSKDFYLEQVHRPRHYKGGESAPLFGNFLEPLTKTAWYIVPIIWLPPVIYGTYIAREGCGSWAYEFTYWGMGLFIWTLVEYILHRFLFHLDG